MAEAAADSRAKGWGAAVLRAILIFYALFQLYTSFTGMMEPLVQRGIFLGLGLGSVFLIAAVERRGQERGRGLAWLYLLLALLGYYAGLHVALGNERLSNFMVELGGLDMALGFVAIALVLEGGRRTIGWFLPLLALMALAYYYFGNGLIDGTWQPPRVSPLTMVETYYASTETLFGYMTDMGTRVIAVFIILGALLLSTGATEVFIKLATRIAGRSHGGQAKVCTASSALFGTVTGSAVANVMALGPITIPTMQRAGYTPAFAAAVEAVASAGGQIMPPVMGAGAFIMAEVLNIPYSRVALAAVIPAVLYFLTLWLSVGFRARRRGIKPLERHELPAWRELVAPYATLPLYLPVAALIVLLSMDYTPTLAGAAAVGVLLVTEVAVRSLRCLAEDRPAAIGGSLALLGRQVVTGLYDGGRAVAMIAVLLACAAIVVKVLTATGAGVKISGIILAISGGDLTVVLVLTAVLAILLGMDVPTTASYILASAVAAPILTKMGVPNLSAHLFIFYFAIMSAITPPVCASVFAAASIARVSFWRVARHAVGMAIALYVIPFLFVFRPGVLMDGAPLQIAYDTAITIPAVLAITAASAGWFVGLLSWSGRLLLFAAGGLLFYAASWADLAGLSLLAGFAALRFVLARSRSAGRSAAPARSARVEML